MKALKIIFMAYGCFFLTMGIAGQENPSTPEYEATRQTEKLQQELNLSPEQVKLVYEINLKYARARQNSTSRVEAMQRVKSKDADLERVLTTDQINKLQTKRYEKSVYQPVPQNNFRPTETTPRTGQPSQRSTGTQMRTTESGRSQESGRGTNDQQRRTPSTGSGERQTYNRQNYPATNYPTGRRESSTGTSGNGQYNSGSNQNSQRPATTTREQSTPTTEQRQSPAQTTPPAGSTRRR